MLVIAIDGACRRNGKPDCTSSGGVFACQYVEGFGITSTKVMSTYEYNSTNQRGEMLALLMSLEFVKAVKKEAQIITDSEYLFNTMTREWYRSWSNNDWVTSSGNPVKNKDLWQKIVGVVDSLETEVHFFHIKGHCMPFGRVTADKLLESDRSGGMLFKSMKEKYEAVKVSKVDTFKAAQELSERNNGFELLPDTLKRFVVANTMADAIATKAVEAADRER